MTLIDEEFERSLIDCEDDVTFLDENMKPIISQHELERLIDERWKEYWEKKPNEIRPKYYQDPWYKEGISEEEYWRNVF